jgi:hypothetical protein
MSYDVLVSDLISWNPSLHSNVTLFLLAQSTLVLTRLRHKSQNRKTAPNQTTVGAGFGARYRNGNGL